MVGRPSHQVLLQDRSEERKMNFKSDDMSCAHCVARITQAVQTLDPAARVDADVHTKQVTVESEASPEAVAAAITDAGYTPVPAH